MFLELLRNRRSIRQFEDKPLAENEIEQLVEAMLRSPSSRSLNPWHFVVVQDRDTISSLAKAKPHGATFMKNAPLAIVVCGDPEVSDVWVEDCSIASLHLHLAAADMGLGSCWVQIRKRSYDEHMNSEEYVARTLDLPEGMRVEAIVAIGHPKETKEGHSVSSLLHDRVYYEKFGNTKE